MTREELINFGEMFLEMNEDSKNSSTYKLIDAAVKLFKQEPKTGHWIPKIDFDDTHFGYCCSECGIWVRDKSYYCPNCGAKMIEPQEESKE